jgi:hypothetical protein
VHVVQRLSGPQNPLKETRVATADALDDVSVALEATGILDEGEALETGDCTEVLGDGFPDGLSTTEDRLMVELGSTFVEETGVLTLETDEGAPDGTVEVLTDGP